MNISGLEEGDRVLFNDRKEPLEVVEVRSTGEGPEAEVEGPGGAVYVLYTDGDTELVATKGRRRYSSYLEDLREIGEWEKIGEHGWEHTGTGARVEVVERGPLYSIEFEGFDPEHEPPGMGYTSQEAAVEDAEKIIESHPEGKA